MPPGTTAPAAVPEPVAGSAAGEPAGPPGAVPAPGSEDLLALRLQITGDCWVRATVDGTVLFEQILTTGDTRDIQPGRDVYLQVGNAGAVKWSINGQPAKELGKPGQTATARVNRATLARYIGP